MKEYIGPDLAQYFSGHDVYTIPHTEVRRKNVRPVQTTEKGLVLVGMPDGGAVTFAGARKMLELKNNRAIVRQKLETVSAKSVCARVEFVRMAIEPDGKTAKVRIRFCRNRTFF